MSESHVIHTIVVILGLASMYWAYKQIKRERNLVEKVEYLSGIVDKKSYPLYKNSDTLREEVVHLSELATLALYKGDK